MWLEGMRRSVTVMALLGLLTAPCPVWSPANAGATAMAVAPALAATLADQLCFAETGQCLDGRFRQFWEQNDGVRSFGFPITPVRLETNPDSQRPLITQWFERTRLEYHPENRPPYDVLLGRLGDERLRQQGRNWRTFPGLGREFAGCRFFVETGRNLCDRPGGPPFLTFWQTHGLAEPGLDPDQRRLALFGLPLGDLTEEANASGDRVRLQWFERGRLEWHPDRPEGFRVQLGLLGREVGPPADAPSVPAPPARS